MGLEQSHPHTLVFMDPEDELVSLKDLRKNIKNFGLSNWEIREVSASLSKLKPKYHHLIIDSDCVDPETWRGICQRLLDFFGFSIPE